MANAYLTLNLPLSIVYLYYPQSRQWTVMALLAIPGLVLPALCSTTRLYRMHAGTGPIGMACGLGSILAALSHHAALMALVHVGIYLGDRAGFTRLPGPLQADLAYWKKHFAEQPGYWLPNPGEVVNLEVLFSLVALLTVGWLYTRQRLLGGPDAAVPVPAVVEPFEVSTR